MIEGTLFARLFGNGAVIDDLMHEARLNAFEQKRLDLNLERNGREPLAVHCVAVVPEPDLGGLLLEQALDVFGVAPAHYTSDLLAVNRSAAPTRITLRYFPAPGTPGGGGPRERAA